MTAIFWLLIGCGGGGSGSGSGSGEVSGEIRTESGLSFPLRAGVAYTDAADGVDRIGLASIPSAGCNVADWWILADDWAYLLVDPATGHADFDWGHQVAGGFEGGSEPLDAVVTLGSFDAAEGGATEGEATFADPFDEVARGSATFAVEGCGVVSTD